jgi:hypothetical protein
MKKKRPRDGAVETLTRQVEDLNARRVDQLYGLEPVYEPAETAPGARPEEFVAFQCPWCGERLETRIDMTGGEHTCIEDCQVCCRPMEMTVELAENGALRALRVQRLE